jgi:uncharacterized membrane protein YcaP (DUF421 family)
MQELLVGNENWAFLGTVALRTALMFVVILGGLRLMGKRGIKQLSVFELGVIIGLGSAAGDPMFYSDVGLLPALVVFAIVLTMYRLLEIVLNKSEATARKLEGVPIEVLRHGTLTEPAMDKIEITTAELFAALRLHSISHLGQLDRAIVEANGEVSVYFVAEDDVKPGLPIIPSLYDQAIESVAERALYSCRHCAKTVELSPGKPPPCVSCNNTDWTRALDGPLIR